MCCPLEAANGRFARRWCATGELVRRGVAAVAPMAKEA